MRRSLVLCAALSLGPAIASAQASGVQVAPGTRVRVMASGLVAPLVANFLQMKGDTAVFIEDGAGKGVWSFPVSQISRLERSIGERPGNKPYMIRWAAYGAAGGAGAALLLTTAFKPSDASKAYDKGPTALIGAAVGAGIGAYIGSRFAQERWTSVALPQRLSIAPVRRGVHVGLGFDF